VITARIQWRKSQVQNIFEGLVVCQNEIMYTVVNY
jgi:hypothetical protein